jgi:glycolate oxidase
MLALEKALPAGSVLLEETERHRYGSDAWQAHAMPDAVVLAKSTADVVTVLKLATQHRVPVTARGAGRGYVGGCVPERGGIVLSLEKMKRVLELNTIDGVARVQPGVITASFQERVKARGWFYPPDPASRAECSLGGNVATNAGGPRCLKYGVTRPYVLGLEVVLADGTVARVGGRTHKNKTGFDLVGMFVGAEGLLGIVTEMTLRLIPQPRARAGIAATFPRPEQAAAAVNAIFAAGFLPAAMEMADAFTLAAAREHLGAQRVPPGKAHLLVEVDGSATATRVDIREMQRILKACGSTAVRLAPSEAACEALWETRRLFSASLKARGLTKMNEDITVPRSRLVDLFKFAQTLEKKHGFPVACFGHAGDGNIHVNIMIPKNITEGDPRIQRALDDLFTRVLSWGGAITGEHGIGLAKLPWWEQATSPAVRELHARLKKALDPDGLLNPGKFV